jgi:fumarate hydratase, class II
MRSARRPLSLGDASEKLRRDSVAGTELDRDKISDDVDRSLMIVTALSAHIGDDKVSAIGHKADHDGTREPLPLGVWEAEFERIVNPRAVVGQPRRDRASKTILSRGI